MNALKEYTRLWIELDALWARGEGESEAAEAIRDRSDETWRTLTEEELDAFRAWVTLVDKEWTYEHELFKLL